MAEPTERTLQPSRLRLGHADAIALLEVIDGSVHCADEERFRRLFSRLQGLLPFEHACAALGRRDDLGGVVVKQFVNVSCLDEFVHECMSRDYLRRSALSRDHFTTYRPKFWSEARRRLGQPREFVSLALDLGMRNGYTTGVRPPPGAPLASGSMFCLSVPAVKRDARTEAILDLVVPHLHGALCRVFDERRRGMGVALSAREKEILRLMAQGKSSWEMSVIVGISESTVNYHVYNVMQKLEAVNRPQAVAVAAQRGLVEVG
jgi:LuxR family transcriptional regulator, quorum-sensing system regulator CviR